MEIRENILCISHLRLCCSMIFSRICIVSDDKGGRFHHHITHRIHVWYIYANIGGILMVNVTIYSIHGSYG